MLLPNELEGRIHLITLIRLLLSDYYYQINKNFWRHIDSNSRTSRFYHNALTGWAIGPYSSDDSYQIFSVRLLLSRIWLKSWSKNLTSSSWETVIRISDLDFNPDHAQLWTRSSKIITSLPAKLHWNLTSRLREILLTDKQTHESDCIIPLFAG